MTLSKKAYIFCLIPLFIIVDVTYLKLFKKKTFLNDNTVKVSWNETEIKNLHVHDDLFQGSYSR